MHVLVVAPVNVVDGSAATSNCLFDDARTLSRAQRVGCTNSIDEIYNRGCNWQWLLIA